MTSPLSILLVEDEPLIVMMMEDVLDELGHQVAGSADSVVGALAALDGVAFDVAILDLRLRDGPSWAVADALADRGLPYLLATGGHVEPPPSRHAGAPVLVKPFTFDAVRDKLDEIMRGT